MKGSGLLTFKDAKISGAANGVDPNLSTLGLNFAAGDLLVALTRGISSHGASMGAFVAGAATGWTDVVTPLSAGDAGSAFHMARAMYKVAAGGETTVDLLNFTGSSLLTYIYHFYSFSLSGSPTLGASPASQATSGNPSAQTIDTDSLGTVSLVAFSFGSVWVGSAIGTGDLTLSVTPDRNDALDVGNGSSRTHMAAFATGHANLSADLADLGTANMHISFAIGAQ